MRRIALLGSVLALVLAAAGCGGGGGGEALSKDEYVSKLNAICAEFNQKQNELGSPQSIEDLAEFVDKALPEFDKAIAEVKDLNPPDELQDQHDEFVSLGEQQRDLLEQVGEAAKDGDEAKVQELGSQGDGLDTKSDAIANEMGATECTK